MWAGRFSPMGLRFSRPAKRLLRSSWEVRKFVFGLRVEPMQAFMR
jgi:hypothetical protein